MKSLSYRYPCASLSAGSSFGNPFAFARLDARSNLLGLWSSADNQFYAGEWHIDLLVGGQTLEGTETIFRPTTQSTIFAARGCRVEKLFLLPFRPIDDPLLQSRKMRGAIFIVRAVNGPQAVELSMRHAVTFPAVPTELFTKQPNKDQLLKKV